jgi:hypothetical protein
VVGLKLFGGLRSSKDIGTCPASGTSFKRAFQRIDRRDDTFKQQFKTHDQRKRRMCWSQAIGSSSISMVLTGLNLESDHHQGWYHCASAIMRRFSLSLKISPFSLVEKQVSSSPFAKIPLKQPVPRHRQLP